MMVVTLGQQYNTGEKPSVMLYIYIINRHVGTLLIDKNKNKIIVVHNSSSLMIILPSALIQ